jgi:hypothetical protein
MRLDSQAVANSKYIIMNITATSKYIIMNITLAIMISSVGTFWLQDNVSKQESKRNIPLHLGAIVVHDHTPCVSEDVGYALK